MLNLKGFLKKQKDEIVGIASTESKDRGGEVIKLDGWDLRNFKKNPVILAFHNHNNFPIGKATQIAVKDGKLMFKAVLTTATEEARAAKQLIEEEILRGFSVGFIPRERSEKDGSIITKAELLEVSVVPLQSNPDAVVMAKGLDDNLLVKEYLESKKEPKEEPKEEPKPETEAEPEPTKEELEEKILINLRNNFKKDE